MTREVRLGEEVNAVERRGRRWTSILAMPQNKRRTGVAFHNGE